VMLKGPSNFKPVAIAASNANTLYPSVKGILCGGPLPTTS